MITLAFMSEPDYEMPGDADGNNIYEVTVVATDATGRTGMKRVTIMVTNMDETGMVTLSTVQPRVGVELTASLTDPDGPASGERWQWKSDISQRNCLYWRGHRRCDFGRLHTGCGGRRGRISVRGCDVQRRGG